MTQYSCCCQDGCDCLPNVEADLFPFLDEDFWKDLTNPFEETPPNSLQLGPALPTIRSQTQHVNESWEHGGVHAEELFSDEIFNEPFSDNEHPIALTDIALREGGAPDIFGAFTDTNAFLSFDPALNTDGLAVASDVSSSLALAPNASTTIDTLTISFSRLIRSNNSEVQATQVRPVKSILPSRKEPTQVGELDAGIGQTGPPKRRRINKKPPQPNNLHGRNGTLGCRTCRNRKQKCVFSSLNAPCDFCVSRSIHEACIKISAAENSPSKPLTINQQCDGKARPFLEYAYSEAIFNRILGLADFLRALGTEYGQVPSNLALRHAICAYSAANLPGAQFGTQFENYIKLAYQRLSHTASRGKTLEGADLFGAALIIWALHVDDKAVRCGVGLSPTLKKIGTLMFNRVTESINHQHNSYKSEVLRTGVMMAIREYFVAAFSLACMFERNQERRITFKQRAKYLEELIRFSQAPEIFVDPSTEAVWDLMHPLLALSFGCLRELVAREIQFDSRRRQIIKLAREYIWSELNDPEYQVAIAQLRPLMMSSVTLSSTLGTVIFYVYVGMWCMELLETVLEAETILIGFYTLSHNPSLTDIIPLCNKERLQGEGDFRQIPMTHKLALILGGCGLLKEEDNELRSFVGEQLETMGEAAVARHLQQFWRERSLRNLEVVITEVWSSDRFLRRVRLVDAQSLLRNAD